jgi:hypothetical protein
MFAWGRWTRSRYAFRRRVESGSPPRSESCGPWICHALTQDTIGTDAALLEVELPEGVTSELLGRRKPELHQKWASRAFPYGSSKDDRGYLRAQAFTGSVAGSTSGQSGDGRELQLSVHIEPDRRAEWAGASGGPVVIDGELRAVLRAYQASWGNSLFAVPTWVLLDDPSFVEALGCHPDVDEWRRHRVSSVEALSSRLDADRDVSEQLARVSKLPLDPTALAKGLMGLTLERFCGFCNVAHGNLVELGRGAAAKALYGLVKELVPLVVDSALVESVVRSGEGRIVELRADTLTLAALVSAAADKQPLVAQVSGPSKDTLKFPLHIDSEGELAGKGGADAIVNELRNGLLERDVGGLFRRTSIKKDPDQELCAYLQHKADPESVSKPYRYFYAYEPTAVGRAVAEELNRRFPLIRTFELSGAASGPDERRLTLALFDILLRGG